MTGLIHNLRWNDKSPSKEVDDIWADGRLFLGYGNSFLFFLLGVLTKVITIKNYWREIG